MPRAETLTLSEAGYVLQRSPAVLNKAVDTGVIRARQRRAGKVTQRLLGPAELRFLRLADELEKDLTPAGRRRLYEALRKLPSETHTLQLGQLELDLARIDRDLARRLNQLQQVNERIDRRAEDAEPMIRGTDISAYLIAALAREESVNEILADFPSLQKVQVEAAIEYAKAYPKRGRPYAARSLKRALGDLADLGVFDADGGSTEAAPRTIP